MPGNTYVAIEGPIGVGKTTLARRLQPMLQSELVLEIFEENPFLSSFYADRERFAFQTQIFFLLSRYRQQRGVLQAVERNALISDYIFAKDRLFAHLNLHGDELEMYERLHSALAERVRQPDLVVYLRAQPEVLMERIATRDRPYERSMSPDYIGALATAYEHFFAGYHETRLLVIDTDRLNVVREPADLLDVAGRINAALAQNGFKGEPEVADSAPVPVTAAVAPAPSLLDERARLALYGEFLGLQATLGTVARAMLDGSGDVGAALAACQGILRRIEVNASR